MLFSSYEFLFIFLPITVAGYQIAAHFHRRAVVLWLSFASLIFYAYWRPVYLVLLCSSILFNYSCGRLITRRIRNGVHTGRLLTFAIVVNLGTLCYYKYLSPALNFVSAFTGSAHHFKEVILPLGISFFTFTQIAYLVDLQQGVIAQQDLGSYTLFATFFPHLIAGPVLHHAEIMPQFQQRKDYRLHVSDVAVGLTWLTMGLFKKVVLADGFATGADAAFLYPKMLSTTAAWAGVLLYALQLYFDFSGYSDMALGLARMFSIDFPLNFSSPYKATNITDFWNRWHMTLTRYITAYLYTPASLWINQRRIAAGKKVSRKATATPEGFLSIIAFPTLFSLFIAGVWHGAGLQFCIFGLLHGIYLSINQAWRTWRITHPTPSYSAPRKRLNKIAAWLLTFVAVCVGHVFFRSATVPAAFSMLRGMIGLHHASDIAAVYSATAGAPPPYRPSIARWGTLVAGYFIVWALPNSQQILLHFKPALSVTKNDQEPALFQLFWKPTAVWGVVLGLVFFYVIVKMQNSSSFLYFQF